MATKINPNDLALEERIIRTNRVQKTHKGGRTLSWSVLIVVGDKNGYVGAGLGKALNIPDAIRKGVETAKKNLMKVPTVGSTIPHEITVKYGASTVLLRPASPGTGVVAGGAVRAILEAAGVKDVLAKSLGSSNPVNNAWATIKALSELTTVQTTLANRGVPLDRLSVRPELREAAMAEGWAMPRLKVTLVKSPIGYERNQRAMAESLGLRKIRSSNTLPDNDATRGVLRKIRHLVTVEEVED